jgi:hypothetical protein
MINSKTPAQRKVELDQLAKQSATILARSKVVALVESGRWHTRGALLDELDAHARACIDEAVAPALEYIDHCIELHKENFNNPILLECIRKLLTGRAGT